LDIEQEQNGNIVLGLREIDCENWRWMELDEGLATLHTLIFVVLNSTTRQLVIYSVNLSSHSITAPWYKLVFHFLSLAAQ